MCKHAFYRKIHVCSRFSRVRSSHNLCVRAYAHSLEGTLVSKSETPKCINFPCPLTKTANFIPRVPY